jgi:hypothetical protein
VQFSQRREGHVVLGTTMLLMERALRRAGFFNMDIGPLNRCCRYVGWASAMMTFAGMGSFALFGVAADFWR